MKRWLASFALVFVLAFCLTSSTSADNANVSTATTYCSGLIHTGAIVQPLVQCFTDTTSGIIPTVTNDFLSHAQADYTPMIATMLLLAVAYFGFKLYLGQIERIKGEAATLILKMAGIMLFVGNATTIYTDLINVMQQLCETMSQITTSLHTTGFCAKTAISSGGANNSSWQLNLWQGWDCIFQYLLGFSATGFAASSIAAFLLMILLSMGTGFIIFFVGVYLIFRLIIAALRFIHVYLMSVLALSFVFCLGFLLVPLLLFKNTARYFTKWLSLIFGFIITPVMMFAFMGMMLVALDISIFSGNYSVYCKIGGASYCGNNSANGANLFKNLTSNVIPAGTSNTVTGNTNLQDNFKQVMVYAFGGPSAINTTDSSVPNLPVNVVSDNTGVTGFQGQLATIMGPVAGSTYNATSHPEVANGGFDMVRLNMTAVASAAGNTCNTSSYGSGGPSALTTVYSDCPWIEGVLVSLIVALLITYIMGSLLEYIPKLASNITTSLNDGIAGQGMSYAMSPVFGEKATKRSLSGLKSKATDYANKARSSDSTLTTKGRNS